jgi:hypothetical protein
VLSSRYLSPELDAVLSLIELDAVVYLAFYRVRYLFGGDGYSRWGAVERAMRMARRY